MFTRCTLCPNLSQFMEEHSAQNININPCPSPKRKNSTPSVRNHLLQNLHILGRLRTRSRAKLDVFLEGSAGSKIITRNIRKIKSRMQQKMAVGRQEIPERPDKGASLDRDREIAEGQTASQCARRTEKRIKTILRYQTMRATLSYWTDTIKSAINTSSRMAMRA